MLYNKDTAFDIMAHAIPARTHALGQVSTEGEVDGNPNMQGFTNSNQDHSAPFHGYYSEFSANPAAQIQQRATYWNDVLIRSLLLIGTNDRTGLKH